MPSDEVVPAGWPATISRRAGDIVITVPLAGTLAAHASEPAYHRLAEWVADHTMQFYRLLEDGDQVDGCWFEDGRSVPFAVVALRRDGRSVPSGLLVLHSPSLFVALPAQ